MVTFSPHTRDSLAEQRRALEQRLAPLRALPDGVVYEHESELHHIRIIKQVGQMQFYFVDRDTGDLDGPMSRLDLATPLCLLAGYTQAATLALLWQPKPQRICMLGLAGGCLSQVFYHHLPDTTINNVDIDPASAHIAATYFGLQFDQRQTLAVTDARAFLTATTQQYAIILMDAFRDTSDQLDHLATTGFYATCKQRLVRGGVMCANLLKSDSQFREKVKTFLQSFQHVTASDHKYSLVLFGSDQPRLSDAQRNARANQLQRQHQFAYPFVELAAALQPAHKLPDYAYQALRNTRILSDPARDVPAGTP